MKDFVIAVSIAGCLSLGVAVWRGMLDRKMPSMQDDAQYSRLMSIPGAADVSAQGGKWATTASDYLAGREWSRIWARGGEESSAVKRTLYDLICVPSRRLALFVALYPILVPLVLASLGFGLYLREESLLSQRWRSPTVAYLAKKSFFYPGVLGVMLFCTLPMSLPLWLIYVVLIPLCGGLTIYVGSIGKI